MRFYPIYSAVESDRGGNLLADFGVQTDVVVDPESELFRNYRVAGKVFPLNVIIGRDGTIVHIDNDLTVEAAVAALASEI